MATPLGCSQLLIRRMCSPSQQRYPRAPWPPASGAAWTDPAAHPDAARAPRREMRTSWMASLRGLGVWARGRVVRERSKSLWRRAHTKARNPKLPRCQRGCNLTLLQLDVASGASCVYVHAKTCLCGTRKRRSTTRVTVCDICCMQVRESCS